ncbi:hypothetical protein D917_06752 [Trichinella nativa]|uniref:Uncharacterized protein n=1 Tax=Trichinella nativa TaxID=6335 RepID=A0A1Y3ESD2_9BILA|nr:hypothetical protein D917_06752 [Trichinella nativa]
MSDGLVKSAPIGRNPPAADVQSITPSPIRQYPSCLKKRTCVVWQAPYLKGHCPFKGCWAQQHTIANAAVKPASPRVLDLKRLRSPPVLVGSQPRPSIVDRFSTR